jgi:hypothetical protein
MRAVLGLLFVAPLCAQSPSPFATRVVAWHTNGNAGGGVFAPTNALGPPRGGGAAAGSTDVHSLGIGGFLELGFDVVVRDGPGADLLIAENAFFAAAAGWSFAEVAFVEVSSNGVDFARLPSAYLGPAVEPGPFGTLVVGSYENMAGSTPVYAGSAAHSNADPLDVVEAGGDAIDLGDLVDDPLVRAGRVALAAITRVRLVDMRSGVDRDARGVVVRDAGAGSADIDAVTALHWVGDGKERGPWVELDVPADGAFVLTLGDPDGLGDLDLGSLRAALFGIPIDPLALLAGTAVVAVAPDRATFRLPFALPSQLRYRLSFSLRDRAGHRAGASRSRPDGR